jgi:hypothetical protein
MSRTWTPGGLEPTGNAMASKNKGHAYEDGHPCFPRMKLIGNLAWKTLCDGPIIGFARRLATSRPAGCQLQSCASVTNIGGPQSANDHSPAAKR